MVKLKKIGNYSYDLDEKLGQGNFAQVFKGFHNDTPDKKIAIKVLEKSKIKEYFIKMNNQFEEYLKQAFNEEIAIMMKLKSENIIKLIHVNETKNCYYMMLELARDGTFRNILERKDKQSNKIILSEKEAYNYLIQLLNGFGEMTNIGVIHRDIKPDNIFIENGILKIGDFGFAKNSQLDSTLTTVVGSPGYMAPQILKESPYNYKCDIWSLGVLVYEMIVGQIPFKFKTLNISDFYEVIENTKIKFPQNIQISNNMKDFILGCLTINQQQRFDWYDVFNHLLFNGVFRKNFQNQEEREKSKINIVFIMGQIRTSITENNLNLKRQFSKIQKKQLTTKQFEEFVGYLFIDMEKKDIHTLCNYLSKQIKQNNQTNQTKIVVALQDFQRIILKYGCKFIETINKNKQIPTTSSQLSNQVQKKEKKQTFLAKRFLAKNINIKKIEVYDLISQEINEKQMKQINFQMFLNIIYKIEPNIPKVSILQLFENDFETHKQKSISINKFLKIMIKICKQFSQFDVKQEKID